MSKQKTLRKVKCSRSECGYKWSTIAKTKLVTCPSCGYKTENAS